MRTERVLQQLRSKGASLVVLIVFLLLHVPARAQVTAYTLPAEIASDRFIVLINGQSATLAHAAENYYFLNFELKKKAKISITAPVDDYWAKGIEVQPWRENIRPLRQSWFSFWIPNCR